MTKDFIQFNERAYKFINDMSTFDRNMLDNDTYSKIKNISTDLGFLIEDIDKKYKWEFFGIIMNELFRIKESSRYTFHYRKS